MKKIGLFFLAVAMAVSFGGCQKDRDADPVGTWVTTYDWGCNGSSNTSVDHFYNNGTYIDSFGGTGTWSVSKNSITVNYANGTVYSGTIDGDVMSGTMVSAGTGGTGCWSAYRTSKIP